MQPTPYFRKVKTNKDGRPRKQRKGWGRFQSVLRERSADFNLTLDVQNLLQEVQDLTTLRDLLCSQSLVQRNTPEGSLSRLVNEYFQVFRTGAVLHESGRKRLMDDRDQRAFLHSMMDEQVDVGNGLCGPDIMMDQMSTYSKFLRFICMTGQVDSIVTADDSVLISVRGSFLFQVMRSTIEMVFPHIMGDEWLVAQLVGQEVTSAARSTFHFNAQGKCFKYDVDMDFVDAFTSIVKDPHVVDILLGRALIAENAMLGVAGEPALEEKVSSHRVVAEEVRECYEQPGKENCARQNGLAEPVVLYAKSIRSSSVEFCQRIVDDYVAAFERGYQNASSTEGVLTPAEVAQRDFLLHRLSSSTEMGVGATVEHVEDRWYALSECFEVLGFQQKGLARIEGDNTSNIRLVQAAARYILRINSYTIQSVFPHLLSNMPLLDALVEKSIMVPSKLCFSLEKTTGRISKIDEEMDFASAIAELLPDPRDLPLVMSQALLARDGVDFRRPVPQYPLKPPQPDKLRPQLNQTHGEQQDYANSAPRSMNMADILS
jgi:hypothetical protein